MLYDINGDVIIKQFQYLYRNSKYTSQKDNISALH